MEVSIVPSEPGGRRGKWCRRRSAQGHTRAASCSAAFRIADVTEVDRAAAKSRPAYGQRETYCTVSVPDPVVPPELAPMTVVPAAKQLARPAAFGPLAIVATLATEELQ
jgi:hypothetical protein